MSYADWALATEFFPDHLIQEKCSECLGNGYKDDDVISNADRAFFECHFRIV